MAQALEHFSHLEAEIGPPELRCPCHNDLLPVNLIDDGRAIWLLDWEYAGVGDAFFDLANLAANNHFESEQEIALLRHYFGGVRPADHRRLRLMRLASDMREAMWGFLQLGISELDFDYRSYACRYLRSFEKGYEEAVKQHGRD